MKGLLLLSFLLLMFFTSTQAQDFYIKDRINVKIGYYNYPWMGDNSFENSKIPKSKMFTPAGIFEAGYGLLNNLEAGAYLGFSMYERANFENLEKDQNGNYSGYIDYALKPKLLFGISLNIFSYCLL